MRNIFKALFFPELEKLEIKYEALTRKISLIEFKQNSPPKFKKGDKLDFKCEISCGECTVLSSKIITRDSNQLPSYIWASHCYEYLVIDSNLNTFSLFESNLIVKK